MKTVFLLLSMLAACAAASAQGPAPEPKPWKDAAELSYVKTSGNTQTSTLSMKNLFNYDWNRSALEVAAGGLGTQSRKVVTAEQFNASEKVSLKLSDSNYAFEKFGWNKDRFSGIKHRYEWALGLGRELLKTPSDKLFAEAGGGYIFEDRLRSDNQSFSTYRGYAKYIRTLSPTANASQDLEYLGNLKDQKGYRMNAETALVSTINSHFSLKASYLWKFVNSPTPGFKKTDTTTSVAVIVNY